MTSQTSETLTPEVVDALRAIVGPEQVIAGEQELLVYECDAYTLEKHPPGVVVLPKSTEEVVAIVKLCAQHKLPIIPRGAGTSLSGTVLAVTGGVMIAMTHMNRILEVDYRNRRALVGLVQAGLVRRIGGQSRRR